MADAITVGTEGMEATGDTAMGATDTAGTGATADGADDGIQLNFILRNIHIMNCYQLIMKLGKQNSVMFSWGWGRR
jgi:hypothetical protein